MKKGKLIKALDLIELLEGKGTQTKKEILQNVDTTSLKAVLDFFDGKVLDEDD